MKRFLKMEFLPLAVILCAIITYVMRLILWKTSDGLLPIGSVPDVISWILVALVMALLVFATRKIQGENKYSTNFPPSLPGAIAMIMVAVNFLFNSIGSLVDGTDKLGTIGAIVGLVATAAMVLLAFLRFKGLRPNMLLHTVVCVYLMLYLVSHYRLWSSAPQLQAYAFELLAIVFVMLACYQRAAFDALSGNCKTYTFFTLAALYFCIAALPSCDDPTFFISCTAWMGFTPCRLASPSREEA